MAVNTRSVSRSCSLLANVEEHTGLAGAITRLSDVYDSISHIHESQASTDFFTVLETTKDYLGLIESIKAVLAERQRQYRVWKDTEVALNRKQEQKTKLELAQKQDKVPQLESEIREVSWCWYWCWCWWNSCVSPLSPPHPS